MRARGVLGRGTHGTAPFEGLVLYITLAELPGDLRPPELHPHIERMRGIVSFLALQQVQSGVEVKGIGGGRHAVAIIDVDADPRDVHAVAGIADLGRDLRDLGLRIGRLNREGLRSCRAQSEAS